MIDCMDYQKYRGERNKDFICRNYGNNAPFWKHNYGRRQKTVLLDCKICWKVTSLPGTNWNFSLCGKRLALAVHRHLNLSSYALLFPFSVGRIEAQMFCYPAATLRQGFFNKN